MHLELGAKKTVGVHYATWILSDEHYLAPPNELAVAAIENNVSMSVIPGQMGRTMLIPLVRSWSEESNMGSDSKISLELTLKEVRGGKCVLWQ